jgi:hypothetical protein
MKRALIGIVSMGVFAVSVGVESANAQVYGHYGEVFYSRFFELAPDARRLFPDDMERQQLKLMDMITEARRS